jgi:hypothetical protein
LGWPPLEYRFSIADEKKTTQNFWDNLFCSAKKLFCSVNFFPPKFLCALKDFPFPKYKKKNLAEKKLTEQKSFFAEQKRLVPKFFTFCSVDTFSLFSNLKKKKNK